jgi:CRISPR-associated protein Cas1
MQDLHELPKLRDSWSYVYFEHCCIDQDAKAVAASDASGKIAIPCASLTLLMLGPGTSITQAAIRCLASHGCMIVWCGEGSVRFYSLGMGETRSSRRLLRQACLYADPASRLRVAVDMYRTRFRETLPDGMTLQQLRGREGIRVRSTYAACAQEYGVSWGGRAYRRDEWTTADPVNRALSAANSCLYGVCHAAIVAAGYSPAIGFIHTGKMLSFVYDVADLYKTEVSIPAAFRAASQAEGDLEGRVRRHCRDCFLNSRLLERIVPDLATLLGGTDLPEEGDLDTSDDQPGHLWDPVGGAIGGGVNYEELDEQIGGD